MKRNKEPHTQHDRWLVSYADFITLLFAFFVMLYATSKSDTTKMKTVMESIRKAFSVTPQNFIDLGGYSNGNKVNIFDSMETPGGRMLDLPAGKIDVVAQADPQLQEIRELLEESMTLELAGADASQKVQTELNRKGLAVRIVAPELFSEGSAGPNDDLIPILDQIGKVVAQSKRSVRIEGHADVDEHLRAPFSSTWDLSAARAGWLARYWIQKFGIDPEKVSISGYGQYRPLTHARNNMQKAKNRRIEVILLDHRVE